MHQFTSNGALGSVVAPDFPGASVENPPAWQLVSYTWTADSATATITLRETTANTSAGADFTIDDISLCSTTISVLIDIKPGSYPNSFNINGNGVIPVAVLGSATFDVTQINRSTLSFGGLEVRVKGNGDFQCSIKDVNGDGYDDLVCQFVDDPEAWTPGETTATLTGNLLDGTPFEGTDEINIVP